MIAIKRQLTLTEYLEAEGLSFPQSEFAKIAFRKWLNTIDFPPNLHGSLVKRSIQVLIEQPREV